MYPANRPPTLEEIQAQLGLTRQEAKAVRFGAAMGMSASASAIPRPAALVDGLTSAECLVTWTRIQREELSPLALDGKTPRMTPNQIAAARTLWSFSLSVRTADAEIADKAQETSVYCQGDWTSDEENL